MSINYYKRITIFLVIFSLLSLSSNCYFFTQKSKNLNELLNINLRGLGMCTKVSKDTLIELSKSGWKNPYLLSNVVKFTNSAEIYAWQITNMGLYVDNSELINDGRFNDAGFYFREVSIKIEKELSRSLSGEDLDINYLEKLKSNLEYASYPPQNELNLKTVAAANNRLLKNR